MRLTQLDMKILFYIDNYEFVALETMAQYLGISQKTLKNRLNDLQCLLERYDIQLDFYNGNQIKIRGRKHFTQLFKENRASYEMDFESGFLLLLALHSDYIVIQDIADKLFVSKSYAEKKISPLLQKYQNEIQSQRHYGLRYKAALDKRIARIVPILSPYIVGSNFNATLIQFHKLHFPVLDYFTQQDLEKAEKAIHSIKKMEWFEFTDESIQQLYIYVLLIIHFCEMGITDFSEPICNIQKEYSDIIKWIFDSADDLNITITEDIANYLYYLFLSLRKQKVEFHEQIEQKMDSCVKTILKGIKKILSIDMSKDKQLYQELAVHIYTTVTRADFLKMDSKDYIIGEIKRQYPLGFEMAVITADYIQDMYELSIKNDLLYLTLHYQAAIERFKDNIPKAKVIVVCHFGMSAANIIRSKIERRLSNSVEIVKLCSLQEFLEKEETEYDLIVTTEHILHKNKPVIYVTLAFPEREMKNIEEYVQNMYIKKMLEVQLMEAQIIHIEKGAQYFDAIKQMTDLLEKNGDILPEYAETVLEREELSSTSLFYIAMPHGNPSFVKQTRLVIARMASAVEWDDAKVVCAFLFAATKDMLKDNPLVFSLFYRVLSDPEIEEQIRNLQIKEVLSDDIFRKKLIRILC